MDLVSWTKSITCPCIQGLRVIGIIYGCCTLPWQSETRLGFPEEAVIVG